MNKINTNPIKSPLFGQTQNFNNKNFDSKRQNKNLSSKYPQNTQHIIYNPFAQIGLQYTEE